MKRLLLISVLLTNSVYADCLVRTNTTIPANLVNSIPVDLHQMVEPSGKGRKCTVQYRLHVGKEWLTVEGQATADTDKTACLQALDRSKAVVLTEPEAGKITATTQMVCSDAPNIQVRPVKIGDLIWQSEVDMHPSQKHYFRYGRSVCRMFVQRDPRGTQVWFDQGVICAVDPAPNSRWRVVDIY